MGRKTQTLGKKAFKAGIWYTISTIVVKASTVITTPIYTRLLSASDYGIASTFNSWYSLMLIICSLDLVLSVGRAKQDFPNKLNCYIGSLQIVSFLFTLGLFLVSLLFWKPIQTLTELNGTALFFLFLYLIFTPAVQFAQTEFRYEYRYKENVAILIYTTLSTIVFSLLFIYLLPDIKYMGKIIGTVFPTVLLGSYFWIRGFRHKIITINTKYWKYALTISLPMIIHSVSLNLLATSDRVVITKMVGTEATGIYTLAYQYAILVNVVMNAINQAWQPWFHDNLFVGNKELIKEKTKDLTLFGCFIGVGCVSLAPEMIGILGPTSYRAGVWAVPPIVVGIVCQFMYTNYINIELHLKKTKYASMGTIIAAVLNVGLNIVFVPIYGFVAAAYTTLFSYIVLLIIHLFITRKILGIELYDDLFFFKAFIGVGIISGIFMLMFNNFALRLVIMCFLAACFLAKYRYVIIQILKNKSIIK